MARDTPDFASSQPAAGDDANDAIHSGAVGIAASAPAAPPLPAYDRQRFRRLFTAVMLPMFLAAVDQTLLATATPVISRELGGLRETSWLATAYLLAAVVMVPVYGRLGDRYGRRRLLSIAIVVFALGSVACAAAQTMWALVAGRALQGLGGGGLMTLSQALIGEVVPPRQRARNQTWFAVIFTAASVGGPVLGGIVVHHASWRWLFVVNLPLVAFAFWRLRTLVGDDRPNPVAGRGDPAGIALFAATMATGLAWLSSAGSRFDWLSATSGSMMAATAVFAAGLVAVERRAERPFLPLELLRLPEVRYAVLTVMGFASAMFAMVFYLPVYLQLSLRTNPAESGLLIVPLTFGIVVGAFITGRVIVRTGRPTLVPRFGLSLAALSLIGLALLPATKTVLTVLEVTTGIGLGGVMSVMQIVTQTAAGPARLGAAAATVSLARTLGTSVGATAFGALIYGLIGGPAALAVALRDGAAESVRHAFEFAFFAAAGLCLVAAWLSTLVPAIRFDDDRHDATITPA